MKASKRYTSPILIISVLLALCFAGCSNTEAEAVAASESPLSDTTCEASKVPVVVADLERAGYTKTGTVRQQYVSSSWGSTLYWTEVTGYRMERPGGYVKYATCRGAIGPDFPIGQESVLSVDWTRLDIRYGYDQSVKTWIGQNRVSFTPQAFMLTGVTGWDGVLDVKVQASSPGFRYLCPSDRTRWCDWEWDSVMRYSSSTAGFEGEDGWKLSFTSDGKVRFAQGGDSPSKRGGSSFLYGKSGPEPIVVRITDVGAAEDIQVLPSENITIPVGTSSVELRNESSFAVTWNGAALPANGQLAARSGSRFDAIKLGVTSGNYVKLVPFPGREVFVRFNNP
jgi:hypothetical protein